MLKKYLTPGGGKYSRVHDEIGSNFWISSDQRIDTKEASNFKGVVFENAYYLSTCRSAIGDVLDRHKNIQKAMLPAFTCESVVRPFVDRGIVVSTYPIEVTLQIDENKFKKAFIKEKPDVILVHNYFGFDTLRTDIKSICGENSLVIEDLTQRLFSDMPLQNADYYVGSIRKWMGIPDGAVVSGNGYFECNKEDDELVERKLKAMQQKGEYMEKGTVTKDTFLKEFKEAEALINSRKDTFKMSEVSKAIYCSMDITAMKERRRDNYRFLIEHLPHTESFTPIFKSIDPEVTPFMFPVLVNKNRKEFQQYMASHNIYPTVIWSIPAQYESIIGETSREIYDKILCFHCDQRYDISDMKRIIINIEKF